MGILTTDANGNRIEVPFFREPEPPRNALRTDTHDVGYLVDKLVMGQVRHLSQRR